MVPRGYLIYLEELPKARRRGEIEREIVVLQEKAQQKLYQGLNGMMRSNYKYKISRLEKIDAQQTRTEDPVREFLAEDYKGDETAVIDLTGCDEEEEGSLFVAEGPGLSHTIELLHLKMFHEIYTSTPACQLRSTAVKELGLMASTSIMKLSRDASTWYTNRPNSDPWGLNRVGPHNRAASQDFETIGIPWNLIPWSIHEQLPSTFEELMLS
ncbi:hypothetical protein H9Q69_002813 [Fusarium xylarioides]|uniref:Uncharacterized protein n=1 Tax=Fusarium xylarioides TaxID=221167 RepID=A0A9P7I0F5_9HYPO|nr:hypothetical protein H9Q70_003373 [Fusarium xylarioides]KAG5769684.1 hypothetical protein H9Q72_003139 [Fusarium xylarioides]KAG5798138.1 hypothetical protein H9Q69_002813 [Fusarium xylarioides]KAG5817253.1 hypothetical protein H9Q71_002013 [Fusarium xylarioides]